MQTLDDAFRSTTDTEADSSVECDIAATSVDQASPLIWDGSLATGHMEIDGDHQYMFSLVHDFEAACTSSQAREEVGQVLCALASHVVGHFSREELLMQRLRYPEFEAHRADHDTFLDRLSSLVGAFEAGQENLPAVTCSFLRRWTIKHINGWDRKLVDFIHARRGQIRRV